jgi:hypothetical protein
MATRTWLGAAVPVVHRVATEIAATYVKGDIITLKIPSTGNTKDLSLTVGTTVTAAQIVLDLVAMVNGAAANQDEERSALGPTIGEWAGITASADDDLLLLDGPSDGRPFTLALYTDSALGTISDSPGDGITGEGPKDFDVTENWSGNTVPVDGDDIIFDHQAASGLRYGLSKTTVEPASVTITPGFKHEIGLPAVNVDNANVPFDESEEQFLKFGASGSITINIDAPAAGMIKIDTNTLTATINITNSGRTTETTYSPVQIKGTHASSTVNVTGGSVGICEGSGTSGQFSTIDVSQRTGNNPIVKIGDSVTLTSATLTVSGGQVTSSSSIGTVVQYGGSFTQADQAAVTTATVDGGVYYANAKAASGATIGTLTVGNKGSVDLSGDLRSAKTITNVSLYAGAAFKDPHGVVTATNDYDIYCKLSELEFVMPPRRTYAISTI